MIIFNNVKKYTHNCTYKSEQTNKQHNKHVHFLRPRELNFSTSVTLFFKKKIHGFFKNGAPSWCNALNLTLLCFWQKLQVSGFIVWVSFVMLLGSVYFYLSCIHVLCGPWYMCCVSDTHFSFFWVMHVKTWCPGKFPGHPDPQIIHVCAPPLVHLTYFPRYYMPIYPCAPIHTHLHPKYVDYSSIHMIE